MQRSANASPLAIFAIFLKLGCTSFGGPVAHIGYLRHEFVEKRRWLDEEAYADLVALCQFLPGPASSQVGMALGASQAGWPGALAAWAGFTAPSALLMGLFGAGVVSVGATGAAGWLHGLKVAAVAVVAQAVWAMGRSLCPDRPRITLAVAAAVGTALLPGATAQLGLIVAGAAAGILWLDRSLPAGGGGLDLRLGRAPALAALALLGALFLILPLAARWSGRHELALFDAFYRAGALVFGGGHVVLPLLRAEFVPTGWIDDSTFLAGYAAAQAVPGPLFTFAAYLGAANGLVAARWQGALLALAGIFLPALLLVMGALPFWENWRRRPRARAAMNGVNAAVVGILLATLYDPIVTTAVVSRADFALALGAFAILAWWQLSPVWVVAACATFDTIFG
jgi:chromate transporter